MAAADPAEFWIEVLRPGTYRLADGRVVTYRPADIRNAAAQGNRMARAGVGVPVCWEHDPRAAPEYLSDLHPGAWVSRGYFGRVTAFREGRDGALYGRVVIPDPADRRQFRKVGWVSPRVDFDLTDPRGRDWPGLVVAHVASTPVPVQTAQRRADPAYRPDFLSRAAAPAGRSRATHYLSHATRIEGPPMADAAETTETTETAGPDECLGRIIDALARLGVKVGGAADYDDLASRLDAIATHSGGGRDPGAGDDDDDAGDGLPAEEAAGPQTDAGTRPAAMPPAMMSRLDALARAEGRDIGRRVDELFKSGRIDKDIQRDLHRRLKAADLSHASLTADGGLRPFDVLAEVRAYEKLPKGRFAADGPADLSRAGQVVAVPRPVELTPEQEAVQAEVERAKAGAIRQSGPYAPTA